PRRPTRPHPVPYAARLRPRDARLLEVDLAQRAGPMRESGEAGIEAVDALLRLAFAADAGRRRPRTPGRVGGRRRAAAHPGTPAPDRKSTRLNSSHVKTSYA